MPYSATSSDNVDCSDKRTANASLIHSPFPSPACGGGKGAGKLPRPVGATWGEPDPGEARRSITGDLPVPVAAGCVRARLREGIVGLADPAYLPAREDLTHGTDLAFVSVMSRSIVILPTREGGRGCAKDAERDRHDQGCFSRLEHCPISNLFVVAFRVINRGGPRFIPRSHSKYSRSIAEHQARLWKSAHATHDLAPRPHAFRSAATARRDASPTSRELAWLVKPRPRPPMGIITLMARSSAFYSTFQPSSRALVGGPRPPVPA
jgi:hypothetical protein